ncbi:MAG: M14 family metallopeptidase [Alphaproteobacteria bacterium]|nr:M14 family metallopeptidase [Alphaproteobacteria bacterium]
MTVSDCFAGDYGAARAKFLAAAAAAGATIETIQHPLRGPAGERLYCDVATLGDPRAPRAMVSMSATHGVEGHCGSGAQVAALREGLFRELPAGTRAVMIHAINPYGFAWSRRVTEDNVDLNRNFVDHGAPYPANAPYAELRDAICPSDWSAAAQARTRARLQAYAQAHGPMRLQQAISGGQYGDPLGVFFGGHAPTWSNRTMRRIFAGVGAHATDIAVIDYHTGLGPYGYGEPIAPVAGNDDSFKRACAWIGGNEVTSPDVGTSTSAPLVGVNPTGMREAAPGARLTMIALEYGVRALESTIDAVRADNWLHAHGDLDSPEGRAIKRQIRDTFYGDEPDWKRMIVDRAFDITRRMMAGLTKG